MAKAKKKPKRSRKTATKAEREQHLAQVAVLYCKGVAMAEIAKRLDRHATQISYDVKQLEARWADSQFQNMNALKARQLEKIDVLERVAWEAWERSIGGKVKTVHSVKGPPDRVVIEEDEDGDPVPVVHSILTEVTDREEKETERDGDPRYLQQVMGCISKRCEILGLYAPKELKVDDQRTIRFDLSGLSTEQFTGLRESVGRAVEQAPQ